MRWFSSRGGIGLKRAPDVRLVDDETTPYVFGFRRPALALPGGLLGMLEPAERRALVLYELAHIRRKDVLVRWLEDLACTLEALPKRVDK